MECCGTCDRTTRDEVKHLEWFVSSDHGVCGAHDGTDTD